MTHASWGSDDFRVIIGTTKIEYDHSKEESNRKKHGYSLESAAVLLEGLVLPGAYRPFISRNASTKVEKRHEHMTFDDSKKVIFFVTTMRQVETVRVISMRRAKYGEIHIFRKILENIYCQYSAEALAKPGFCKSL